MSDSSISTTAISLHSRSSTHPPQINFLAGSVFPAPSILCCEHQYQVTHGCTLPECAHPLYCGQCGEHQHEGQAPYASLKPIDEFTFELSRSLKKRQAHVKSMQRNLVLDADNSKLLQWQEEMDSHLKQIESYVRSQKQLIDQDMSELQRRVEDALSRQKQVLHRKLDDFLRNYRSQFQDFKLYNANVFRIIARKYKYLSDPSIFNAKVNSLDSSQSRSLINEIKALFFTSSSDSNNNKINSNNADEVEEVNRIFTEMNTLVNRLPAYEQLDFDDSGVVTTPTAAAAAGSNGDDASPNLFEELEATLHAHFRGSCKNFFEDQQKLSIPLHAKKRNLSTNQLLIFKPPTSSRAMTTIIQRQPSTNIREVQRQQSITSFSGASSTYSLQNDQPPFIAQKQQQPQPQQQNQLPYLQQQSYQQQGRGAGSESFIEQNSFADQSVMAMTTMNHERRANGYSSQNTKPRIFDNSPTNGISNGLVQNISQQRNNNQQASFFSSHPTQQVQQYQAGGRPNAPLPNRHSNNGSSSNYSGNASTLQSTSLKLVKEFKMKMQFLPRFTCYLSKGYIAMVSTGDRIRVLDVNTGNIYEDQYVQNRDIKFLTCLTTSINSNSYDGNTNNSNKFLLTFAVSTIDSVINLYTFNTKTLQILMLNQSISAFSAPVCRITDLFSITGLPLLAAGDENGEVSVFDYQTTMGKGLDKVHQSPIQQILAIPNRPYRSGIANEETRTRFLSLGQDQVLVIYEMQANSSGLFQQVLAVNVSNIGGGVACLRPHPELPQLYAVCTNGSVKLLRFYAADFTFIDLSGQSNLKVRDLAVFSVKDHSMMTGNAYVEQRDASLSGLVFASEQDSRQFLLAKTSYSNQAFTTQEIQSIEHSNRKLLYVDNTIKQFILINDLSLAVQVYDVIV